MHDTQNYWNFICSGTPNKILKPIRKNVLWWTTTIAAHDTFEFILQFVTSKDSKTLSNKLLSFKAITPDPFPNSILYGCVNMKTNLFRKTMIQANIKGTTYWLRNGSTTKTHHF